MAKNVSMNVKSATGKLRPFDMSSSLITTSNFGVMKPIKMVSCVQGDVIDCDVSEFTRLMPMPAPTYGSIISKTRAFFVPCRVLLRGWLQFISNNKQVVSWGVVGSNEIPTVQVIDLLNVFCSNTGKFATKVKIEATTSYDFVHPTNDVGFGFKFTPYGKRVFDWFCSVGCPIPIFKNRGDYNELNLRSTISFLPFMAFLKFYIDWVVPSRFVYLYSPVLQLFEHSTGSSITTWLRDTSADEHGLGVTNLERVLLAFYAYYDDDFFTSAWQNPYGTEVEQATSTEVFVDSSEALSTASRDDSLAYPMVSGHQNKNPKSYYTDSFGELNNGATLGQGMIEGSNGQPSVPTPISYFGLRTLGALQDMINRGKLAGTKVQEYLRTTYGFEPSADALNLSTYLGVKTSEIMIGDVMANAGTEQNALGQYAGRGIGSSSSKFHYECKEHGFFFITNELSVKASYVDGLDFAFDQLDRLDFFDPNFDNLGCDAIPLRRLSFVSSNSSDSSNDTIFGFTPRYSQYKFAFDRLGGDFRVPSLNAGLDSWYLTRTFNLKNSQLWRFINDEFCKASSDLSLNNLDRIFNDTTNDVDHFYSIFRIGCRMMRPMLPFADALETYQHNELGKDMKTSINGGLAK